MRFLKIRAISGCSPDIQTTFSKNMLEGRLTSTDTVGKMSPGLELGLAPNEECPVMNTVRCITAQWIS